MIIWAIVIGAVVVAAVGLALRKHPSVQPPKSAPSPAPKKKSKPKVDPVKRREEFRKLTPKLTSDMGALLSKSMTVDEFREKFAGYPFEVRETIKHIENYLSGHERRQKDFEYARMQHQELAKAIAILRSGSDPALLEQINFLQKSG